MRANHPGGAGNHRVLPLPHGFLHSHGGQRFRPIIGIDGMFRIKWHGFVHQDAVRNPFESMDGAGINHPSHASPACRGQHIARALHVHPFHKIIFAWQNGNHPGQVINHIDPHHRLGQRLGIQHITLGIFNLQPFQGRAIFAG